MANAKELMEELRTILSKIDGMADEVIELANEIDEIDYQNYSELIDMGEQIQETVTNFQEAQGWI